MSNFGGSFTVSELGNEKNDLMKLVQNTKLFNTSKVGNDRGIGNHLHDEVFVNA
jgi:hypothetical protein